MLNRKLYLLLIPAILGILACGLFSPGQSSTATPDNIATGVAEAHAIGATLTAEASIDRSQIYFSVGDTLYRMSLDGTHQELVAKMGAKSEQVFVDNINQKIYVSHWSNQVYVLDLTKNTHNMIQGPDSSSGGQGLAVDQNTSDLFLGLYYGGVTTRNISRNASWQQVVSSEALAPLLGQRGQVQLDPANRQLYFKSAFNGDCGLCRFIFRVDYDGSNLTKIIPANDGDDLALDLFARKMYFSDDPGSATIKRANLDGSEVETIFTIPEPYTALRAIALDLDAKKIYLSLYDVSRDWKARAISRVNMDGTGYEILYEATRGSGDALSGGIGLFLPDAKTSMLSSTVAPASTPAEPITPTPFVATSVVLMAYPDHKNCTIQVDTQDWKISDLWKKYIIGWENNANNKAVPVSNKFLVYLIEHQKYPGCRVAWAPGVGFEDSNIQVNFEMINNKNWEIWNVGDLGTRVYFLAELRDIRFMQLSPAEPLQQQACTDDVHKILESLSCK